MASPAPATLDSASDPGAVAALQSTLASALRSRGRAIHEEGVLDDSRDLVRPAHLCGLDRTLAALCRERGPLRAVLARLASRLVSVRAWERISYARLSDYAVECLGLSARSVQGLAEVGARFGERPRLEDALVSDTLGWTRVRLLARLPRGEDETAWISYARRVTAGELAHAVRAVDRGSVEAGGAEEPGSRGRLFEVRCRPEVRWKWNTARSAAARAAGRVLHVSEAAELIAAEVLSALPIDEQAEEEACAGAGTSWSEESEPIDEALLPPWRRRPPPQEDDGRPASVLHWRAREAPDPPRAPRLADQVLKTPPPDGPSLPTTPIPGPSLSSSFLKSRPSLPSSLRPLLEGLEEADAFELDARFRRAVSMEQRLDARIGPLLARVWGRFGHRALGHATREAYARERLGMDPTRARALVRLERTAGLSEPFARAYRTGVLSWVKASALVPLVSADPLGCFIEDWVAWAGCVTVRRLGEDVERAVALSETDPEAFRRTGGLPPETGGVTSLRRSGGRPLCEGDREIGAAAKGAHEEHPGSVDSSSSLPPSGGGGDDREIGAASLSPLDEPWLNRRPWPLKSAPDEVCWARFIGPPDVVHLFRAVLCTVRRRMEKHTGRLPTAGEALEVMLDHVLSSWGALDGKIAARHKVFARDGWRCAVPGCTSMQNLHDHHIRFRSAGGSDAPENRVTLCAFHHLRGVHAGLLRCVGRAPDGLRWEMGIRPGVTPLLAYRSGDVRVPAMEE